MAATCTRARLPFPVRSQVTSSPVVLGPLGSSEYEESLLFSYSLFLSLLQRSLPERLRGSTRSGMSVRGCGGSKGSAVRASQGEGGEVRDKGGRCLGGRSGKFVLKAHPRTGSY